MFETYLKKGEEVVELLLLCPMVKAHAARVEENADKPDAKEIIWHVD